MRQGTSREHLRVLFESHTATLPACRSSGPVRTSLLLPACPIERARANVSAVNGPPAGGGAVQGSLPKEGAPLPGAPRNADRHGMSESGGRYAPTHLSLGRSGAVSRAAAPCADRGLVGQVVVNPGREWWKAC
jgi:hypothetical protein